MLTLENWISDDVFEDEVEYLNTLFSAESDRDYCLNLIEYYTMESAFINKEIVDSLYSVESLRDKIAFHKHNLFTLFKQLINELIKKVLEFFGIGMSQKKIMLVTNKRIKEAMKSVNKTLQNTLQNKGFYNFSDRSVEIRDTSETILSPIVYLSVIGYILNVNTDNVIDTYISIIDSPSENLGLQSLITNDNDSDKSKIKTGIKDIIKVYVKINMVLSLFDTNFLLGVSTIPDHSAFDSKPDDGSNMSLMVYVDGFKKLINSSLDIGEASNAYNSILESLNLSNKVNFAPNTEGTQMLKHLDDLNTTNTKDIFSLSEIDKMKSLAEKSLEDSRELTDKILDTETVSIDSDVNYQLYIQAVTKASEELSSIFKSLDYKKEMEKIRKTIENIQKKMNSLSGDSLDAINNEINYFKFITTLTYQYNTAKTILNNQLRVCLKSIDNGITDLKKFEASLV